MGVSVTFDYQAWQKRYPEFSTVDPVLAQAYFNEATLYWRNDGTGPVSDENIQQMLLGMLTAHIAKMNATVNGQAPSDIVGRITDATEGSVSVSAEKFTNLSEAAQWFMQTKYGAAFWRATSGFRRAVYRPFNRPMPSGAPFPGRW